MLTPSSTFGIWNYACYFDCVFNTLSCTQGNIQHFLQDKMEHEYNQIVTLLLTLGSLSLSLSLLWRCLRANQYGSLTMTTSNTDSIHMGSVTNRDAPNSNGPFAVGRCGIYANKYLSQGSIRSFCALHKIKKYNTYRITYLKMRKWYKYP